MPYEPTVRNATDSLRACARSLRRPWKGELNGGSTENLSVGSRHVPDRADGLGRGASARELEFQFQHFSNTPLTSDLDEHAANTEIHRLTGRPLAVGRRSHANGPIDPVALRARL